MPTKSTRSAPNPTEVQAGVRFSLQIASRALRIPPAARFRCWVRAAVRGAAYDATGVTDVTDVAHVTEVTKVTDVTIRVVAASEARRLNLAYRNRDYATNALAFAYAPGCGDIVLCAQVLAREAREQGKSLHAHYAHLTVHAILHLLGYKHARTADAAQMEWTEIRILKQLGYPDPYAT